MNWIIKIILNGFALIVADLFVAGFQIRGIKASLIAALILGIINTIIRPILVLFTLPITIFSLGLFILVINAITFALTAWIVDGFVVYSFSGAFWGAIMTTIISWLLNSLAKD
ncbi:hypothetical protein BHF71_06220 [Vulcanibacillus modesticaldus]|uniref:Phage holin family protein n=1 Tax=Vulcanibacillus modesticaldus TaxID=337097 RepID=A0A1D2YWS3_9BACI|nr:phage holin family protein [Vulcanibacillus modesticaldus]OEG00118.1 hypothetical protein BHF71_06220 [Vulcanibacillus modesticaldus]